jgi:hypothetical protein
MQMRSLCATRLHGIRSSGAVTLEFAFSSSIMGIRFDRVAWADLLRIVLLKRRLRPLVDELGDLASVSVKAADFDRDPARPILV